MRVLHVVTLLTPDGAYGGPARVAVNQAVELRRRGNDAVIACGIAGFGRALHEIEGVPVHAFDTRRLIPGVGFASTVANGMRGWLTTNLDTFDVVHIHLGRDLVTAPAASLVRQRRVPYVVQTHGMVTPRSHRLAGLFDRVWTRKAIRSAAATLCLNSVECDDIAGVCRYRPNVITLPNGVPLHTVGSAAPGARPDDLPEVLFLARLHPRKRPELFAEAALRLLEQGIQARFAIVGPPEGSEVAVDRVINRAASLGYGAARFHRSGAIPPDQAPARMSEASVYVLPAAREPFGMTIVEALSVAVPVIIANDGGLADFVVQHDCGLVVDDSVESLASAIETMLSNPDRATAMGARGRSAVRTELSIERVVDDLEKLYGDMLARAGGPTPWPTK